MRQAVVSDFTSLRCFFDRVGTGVSPEPKNRPRRARAPYSPYSASLTPAITRSFARYTPTGEVILPA